MTRLMTCALGVVVAMGCADARTPNAYEDRPPQVTLPDADLGCYELAATGPDSLLQMMVTNHRWITLDATRPAPPSSTFRPGRALLQPEHQTWDGPPPEGYWWREARTDTLHISTIFGLRLVAWGHRAVRIGYAYGVGEWNPQPQRYGAITLTRRTPGRCTL